MYFLPGNQKRGGSESSDSTIQLSPGRDPAGLALPQLYLPENPAVLWGQKGWGGSGKLGGEDGGETMARI